MTPHFCHGGMHQLSLSSPGRAPVMSKRNWVLEAGPVERWTKLPCWGTANQLQGVRRCFLPSPAAWQPLTACTRHAYTKRHARHPSQKQMAPNWLRLNNGAQCQGADVLDTAELRLQAAPDCKVSRRSKACSWQASRPCIGHCSKGSRVLRMPGASYRTRFSSNLEKQRTGESRFTWCRMQRPFSGPYQSGLPQEAARLQGRSQKIQGQVEQAHRAGKHEEEQT